MLHKYDTNSLCCLLNHTLVANRTYLAIGTGAVRGPGLAAAQALAAAPADPPRPPPQTPPLM